MGRLGFTGYFLAVAHVVADTPARGIRVTACGSSAGSMVNHALFVARANPLEHRLLFERFLIERRTSLPDIDLDVESERRLEVYDGIIKRFGRERTEVTGTPETYRARHAWHFPVQRVEVGAGLGAGRSPARDRWQAARNGGLPRHRCRPAEAGSDCDDGPMSASHWLVVGGVMPGGGLPPALSNGSAWHSSCRSSRTKILLSLFWK